MNTLTTDPCPGGRLRMLAWMLIRQARLLRQAGLGPEARRLARLARSLNRYGWTRSLACAG